MLAVLLAPLLAACGLRAQLVLTFDTINKTYWWTGSASTSGTVESLQIVPAHFEGGFGSDNDHPIGSGGLNFSATTLGPDPFDDIFYVGPAGFYFDPIAWFGYNGYTEPYSGTFSGQGSGSPLSYAIGDTVAYSFVTTFDGMPVYLNGVEVGSVSVILPPPSAVPEPATYALVLGCAALGGVAWRRRRSVPPSTAVRGA